jgi:hypothetical protein
VLALKQTAAAIPQIPKIFSTFILRISFCSHYYVVFGSRRIDCWAVSTIPPTSCGLCHCREHAIERKPIKSGGNEGRPAQTLLEGARRAQILRRAIDR